MLTLLFVLARQVQAPAAPPSVVLAGAVASHRMYELAKVERNTIRS
jgi:hypothetical protein